MDTNLSTHEKETKGSFGLDDERETASVGLCENQMRIAAMNKRRNENTECDESKSQSNIPDHGTDRQHEHDVDRFDDDWRSRSSSPLVHGRSSLIDTITIMDQERMG